MCPYHQVKSVGLKIRKNNVKIMAEIRAAGECFYSCLELSQTFTIVSITLENRHDVSNFLQEVANFFVYLCTQ